jgi:hypothetical protein
MKLHGVRPALAVAVFAAAILAACGGGGGGGTGTGGPPPVITTPTPPPPTGYTPPSGAITLTAATSGGVFGSAITAGTANGLMTGEVASTPTEPPSGSAITQYSATVKETAGVGTSSTARSAESARALRALISQNHELQAADRLREQPTNPSAERRLFHTISATRSSAAQSRRTQAAQGTVGQTRQFKIQTANIGNSGGCAGGTSNGTYVCFVPITATLRAIGVHGNVWVDNQQSPGEYTIANEFQTIASRFDAYYATETAAFGPAFYPTSQPVAFTYSASKPQCDSSGNALPQPAWQSTDLRGANGTSIDIVITDALAGTGEGGYYTVVNEVSQQVWDCAPAPKPISNNTSMFVISGNNYSGLGAGIPAQNESYWLNTDVPRSSSHELQHLIHAHYKFFRPIATQTGNGSFDDTFIDEGCSMLAEDLATDPSAGQHIDTPRFSFAYLLEPSLFSLTSFTGFQPNPSSTSANAPYGYFTNTAGNYGQAYLFIRYLYDRFPGALSTIYNTPGPDGSGSSAPGVAPVLAAAGGESYPQLYREFATAVSAQNTSAAAAPYQFSSAVMLRGNVDVPSIRPGAQSTRHLGFGGPQPPETFANNLPTGFLTLGPGVTATTFILDGGILFLPSANGPSGNTITVTIPGAPALEGSLIQGTLPTPPPTST